MTGLYLDGRPATAAELAALSAGDYGHFTTLQVRAGAVQGLDLHLQRLQHANRELFGQALAADRIRAAMRGALQASGRDDASLRLTVRALDFDPQRPGLSGVPALLVRIAPPAAPGEAPLQLASFVHARTLPQLKHVGTLAEYHLRRKALQAGADDALLVDATGTVSEGSFWNIGFREGGRVVWPQAPALRGTCERLLQAGLCQLGVDQDTRPVGLDALADFQGAFIANARGVQAVAAIDGTAWRPDPAFQALLRRALATQPWQPL